jgi:hypothetical protein
MAPRNADKRESKASELLRTAKVIAVQGTQLSVGGV